MGKIKTSTRRKRSSTNMSHLKNSRILRLKKNTGIRESNPTEELVDEELIVTLQIRVAFPRAAGIGRRELEDRGFCLASF
jgi:hypothetical protein